MHNDQTRLTIMSLFCSVLTVAIFERRQEARKPSFSPKKILMNRVSIHTVESSCETHCEVSRRFPRDGKDEPISGGCGGPLTVYLFFLVDTAEFCFASP